MSESAAVTGIGWPVVRYLVVIDVWCVPNRNTALTWDTVDPSEPFSVPLEVDPALD